MGYEKTYFHGTDAENFDARGINPERGCFDLCVTDDEDVARVYAEDARSGDDGEALVYKITVDRTIAKLADEEEAEEIIKEVYGIDALDYLLFEYLDDAAVIEAILEAGFGGVDFVDQCPDAGRDHDTVRLYRADSIVSCERV